MPCDSSIRTKLTDAQRIAESLKALGYEATRIDDDRIVVGEKGSRRISFARGRDGYSASGSTQDLTGISKKYAELGVRAWAKKRGYAITENDGTNMVLVNRRG